MRARRLPPIHPARVAIALIALLALAAPQRARASDADAGTRAAGFLTLGDAPAVLAMGGATLALGRDVQGAEWNPAALGWIQSPQATFAHAEFADQTAHQWLALGGRLAGSAIRMGLSAQVYDEGTLDGRDANDQSTGSLQAQDLAVALQLARPFGEHLAVGGAARVVSQRIGTVGGTGFAFDAGGQLRLGFVSFAVAGQDFGGGMTWEHTRWRMPASLSAGVALEHAPSGLRFALDWNAPADYLRSVRAGAEWCWHERIALRGGWRQELNAPTDDRLGGPAFGVGAGAGGCWVDYGYVIDGAGVATHRLALSLRGRHAAAVSHPTPGVPR